MSGNVTAINTPGLYYLTRDGEAIYRLDQESRFGFAYGPGRPERDVLRVLLQYALESLTVEDMRDMAGDKTNA